MQQQQAERGAGAGAAFGAVTIYTLASVCRLRVADTRNCSISWGGEGSRGAAAVAAHVGIQFYTNLLLFLPKLASSLSNFHSFCSRHTRQASVSASAIILFSKRLLGSCIFYASKSNNLRISYGHTYLRVSPLSPSLPVFHSHRA